MTRKADDPDRWIPRDEPSLDPQHRAPGRLGTGAVGWAISHRCSTSVRTRPSSASSRTSPPRTRLTSQRCGRSTRSTRRSTGSRVTVPERRCGPTTRASAPRSALGSCLMRAASTQPSSRGSSACRRGAASCVRARPGDVRRVARGRRTVDLAGGRRAPLGAADGRSPRPPCARGCRAAVRRPSCSVLE